MTKIIPDEATEPKKKTLLEIVQSRRPDEEFAKKIDEAHSQARKMKSRNAIY
ncbi:MAG TPA: hypothetical protein VJG83_02700 [archaeon]|nr:hypothetical protein [archaeon]